MYGDQIPATRTVLELRAEGVDFKPHFYRYVRSGTDVAARDLGVEEHIVVKTLVMEDENEDPFIILMHGDKLVSAKALARTIKAKNVRPVEPRDAKRLTGYMVGGISPFGTRRKLPVYVERTILNLPRFFVNGGRRGFVMKVTPQDLIRVLDPTPVEVAR